ncbi:hypothetical protein YPPY52_3241, partial [Yersinia pestis PY-52]
MAGGPA